MEQIKQQPDIEVQCEGNIYLVASLTESGRQWLSDNIPEQSQWYGSRLVVEHRYIDDIVLGMQGDGLVVI